MQKQKLTIEYPLSAKSPNIIWDLINSAHGLEKWIADHVTEDEGLLTFTWGEPWTQQDIRSARVEERVKFDHVRLRWEGDEDKDAYWELRIEKSDLTGQLNLLITDFAEASDIDDLRDLWNHNLSRLHRSSGF